MCGLGLHVPIIINKPHAPKYVMKFVFGINIPNSLYFGQ